MENYGALCLLPAAVVMVTAIISKRSIESLILGTVVALLLISPKELIPNFSALAIKVLADSTTAWIILVCSLMGSLIVLLSRTGSATAFANIISKRASSRQQALLYTWILGLLIFIDDYLNALAVSSAMKKVTDKFLISREMLSYVVDSTAAPICILIPISTWAVFFIGLLESSNIAPAGEGLTLYISAIPYMLYAWAAVLIVPLVATGYPPLLGKMAKAEKLALAGKAKIVQHNDLDMSVDALAETKTVSGYNFIAIMLCLLAFTWIYDIDVLIGVLAALVLSIILFGAQKLMTWTRLFDSVLDGIKLMLPALSIVVVAFMFKEVNDQLGLPQYVVDSVKPIMSPKLLPVITFLTMGLIAFATGSFWGILAIALPVVIPLAQGLGVDVPLVLGALLSASAFGSHACFYSDSTVLAAQGSDCEVLDHAFSQLPYILIAATLAAIGLTVLA